MPRLVVILFAALAILTAGCGSEDADEADLLTEDSLRECLAGNGFGAREGAASGGYLVLLPAPDFIVQSEDGTDVSANVYGTEEKARRAAADARAATQTLGGTVEVSSDRNAVLIFNPPPSDETREAATGCLE